MNINYEYYYFSHKDIHEINNLDNNRINKIECNCV